MAKFHGRVGFGETAEVTLGVHTDIVVEYFYYGDVVQNRRGLRQGDHLIPDITVSNSISIVADAYAREHFFAIRYVEWAGKFWTVSDVEVQAPRLILQLGEVYNGPTVGSP
jgi:hypothetical protein